MSQTQIYAIHSAQAYFASRSVTFWYPMWFTNNGKDLRVWAVSHIVTRH